MYLYIYIYTSYINMGVSKNRDTPESSILIGFSIINHPFWGYHYFWKHPYIFNMISYYIYYTHKNKNIMK